MRTIKKDITAVICIYFISTLFCSSQDTKSRFFTNPGLSFYYHVDWNYSTPLNNFELNYKFDLTKRFELATGIAYNTYFNYGDNEHGDIVKIYYKYLSFPIKINFKANNFYLGPCVMFELLLNKDEIPSRFLNTSETFTIGFQIGYNISIKNRIFISPEFRYINQIKPTIKEKPNHHEPFYIGTFYLRNAGIGVGIKYVLKKQQNE